MITFAKLRALLAALAICLLLSPWATGQQQRQQSQQPFGPNRYKVVKTPAEWQKQLTQAQFLVTRLKATEPAWSGRYAAGHYKGIFTCVCCGADLFSSKTKFQSGTGWPSFYQPISREALDSEWDYSGFEPRLEVMCSTCGAHLGHVFNDGPAPTGLRFCINSVALKLKPLTAASSSKNAKSKGAKAKDAKTKGDAKAKDNAENPPGEAEDADGQAEEPDVAQTPDAKAPASDSDDDTSKAPSEEDKPPARKPR